MRAMRSGLAVFVVLAVVGPFSGCGSAAGGLPPPLPPKVTVAAPLVRTVRDADEYTGRIEARETVDVRARVSGYLEDIYFNDGDYVKAGDPLFLIDPRTYKAALDQAEAKIRLYNAKYLYAKSVRLRNEKLVANNSVTREEYEQSVASENEALAERNSAEADAESARLNLEFTKINAEIAGRIDRRYVTKGNLVQSGPGATLLTSIISVDPMYVYFNPDELAFLRYTERRVAKEGAREAQPVRTRHIETTIILADGTAYPEKGTVDYASNTVDPSTGTIQVRAVFPNAQQVLTPGLFVRLKVTPEESYEAVLVPERAIGTDQSDKFVYVIDDKNIAQRHNVELGTKQGRLRVIKKGVQPADRVVISGGLLVRPGVAVEPTPGKITDDLPGEATVTQYRPELPTSPPAQSRPTPSLRTDDVPAKKRSASER
jgi:RND family efflux transporter MFP subunit